MGFRKLIGKLKYWQIGGIIGALIPIMVASIPIISYLISLVLQRVVPVQFQALSYGIVIGFILFNYWL